MASGSSEKDGDRAVGKRLIQDEAEVRRWIGEGRTYAWMVQEYERKYQLQVTPSMFTNFRARRGLARRETRDHDLIPWEVRYEHRWRHPLGMLRAEARVRAGEQLAGRLRSKHASFMQRLKHENQVVCYDPATEEGFHLIAREPEDQDVIREPPREMRTRRRNPDAE
jgi:hypothetical protein